MTTGKTNIRVVVPCYNSDLTIEKCVTSILNSEGIDFELIAVDDGYNNKLASLANHYPIKIIKSAGHEGAGKARNLGTCEFKGQIVVFIDSDVMINPDTIAILVKPIEEKLAEATVGSYSKVHCTNFYETYKHFYLAYRYKKKQEYLTYTFWSAICAIDFRIFTRLNGFNESYSGAGPEDIVFGIDLSKIGTRLLSVPKAEGVHLAAFSFPGLVKNDLKKGAEDIYIHWTRKVPVRYNRHINKTEILSVFLACCILLLFVGGYYLGFIPLFISILLYLSTRTRFIFNAFGGEGLVFLIRSFLLTYILDVIRGLAVIKGTVLFIIEIISAGKYKPFVKLIC